MKTDQIANEDEAASELVEEEPVQPPLAPPPAPPPTAPNYVRMLRDSSALVVADL